MTQATMAYKIALQFKEQALSQLKDRVNSVILYGSASREEYNPEKSDIDILVIGSDESDYYGLRNIAMDIGLENSTTISLVYLSKSKFERFLKAGSSFIGNVLEEGIVLYDNGTLTRIHQSLIKASR